MASSDNKSCMNCGTPCIAVGRFDGPPCADWTANNNVCRWTQDDDGVWQTTCGNAHVFCDGNPKENKYAFCPYCGRTLEQVETEVTDGNEED